ncbi:LytR/AlgR family response regulator transcription factor [Paraclostridium bifermentans]|uniref:LytR/AlgR family response regulator transcription factor n=1 Tax=Paraclostridium bifermentans TaxID=1490 RepID=UPI001A9AA53C|nr:LytTR family DNA-binding domain-containing protein [Paraclostridium bifermentans]
MKIFICEDNEKQLDALVKIVNRYIDFNDFDLKLEMATSNPEDILEYLDENKTIGLYFLDVDLKNDINGIELASRIRQYDLCGKIIFVTTHPELSYLTFMYKVEAMDYIVKDNSNRFKDKINECIEIAYDRYIKENNPNRQTFIIQEGKKQIKIYTDEIKFIESSSTPHKLILHMDNRQIEFYGKIKYMENICEELYRCHQSYVVNINNILEIDKKSREIIMDNGEVCYVSVRYLKLLLRKVASR